VDYNHNRENTGAFLNNLRIENNVEVIDSANDGLIRTIDEALLVNLVVPKTARKYIRKTLTDRLGRRFETNEILDQGSLYEALLRGEIKSVSIEATVLESVFEDKTEIITKWDLKKLSLLSTTPGTPTSRLRRLRGDEALQIIQDITTLDSDIDNSYSVSNNSNMHMNEDNNKPSLEKVLTEEEVKIENQETVETEIENQEPQENEVIDNGAEIENEEIQRAMDYTERMDTMEKTLRMCDTRIKRLEDKLEMSEKENGKLKRDLESLQNKQVDEDTNILKRLEELDKSIPDKIKSNLQRSLQFEDKQTLSKEELDYNRSILANRLSI
jgi:hypothetical protein